ncbi:hypothetical protein UFOVP1623_46 [uncultured Caudovirales phage]|uniref:Uncharacterized protein n=1 Tax=uncultured Caudovirales phage TaxID=2100421 RepID=A0A6J5SYY2_9CAUD|nr:hypothetical protein UFOVP1376_17 [uncultured Caudovirales phage]CAB4220832.1 hypothetical protein UFOVP1623_46 [uncultured Caudovirales phage]
MDPMTMMIQALLGSGGPPGTKEEPWNPASKLGGSYGIGGTGGGMIPPMGGMGGLPQQPPAATDLSGKIGNAIMPNTMAAKGGASGG